MACTRQIEVTLVGGNDAPAAREARLTGAVTESTDSAAMLTDSGRVVFSDADRSDRHLLALAGRPVGPTLGTLTALLVEAEAGPGSGGAIEWRYSVASSAVEHLGDGQRLVERFDVVVDDGHGGVLMQRIEVTVSGVNNQPVVAAATPDVTVLNGDGFELLLPPELFTDLDVGEQLEIVATLADGRPLPSWLVFDARKMRFHGVAPFGVASSLALRVVATDASGATAETGFVLVLDAKPTLALADLPAQEAAAENQPAPRSGAAERAPAGQRLLLLELIASAAMPTDLLTDAVSDRSLAALASAGVKPVVDLRERRLGSVSDQVLAQALVADLKRGPDVVAAGIAAGR